MKIEFTSLSGEFQHGTGISGYWMVKLTPAAQLFLGQRLLALVARHFLDFDLVRLRVGLIDHQNLADVLYRRGI